MLRHCYCPSLSLSASIPLVYVWLCRILGFAISLLQLIYYSPTFSLYLVFNVIYHLLRNTIALLIYVLELFLFPNYALMSFICYLCYSICFFFKCYIFGELVSIYWSLVKFKITLITLKLFLSLPLSFFYRCIK